jgi:hypothetical protein
LLTFRTENNNFNLSLNPLVMWELKESGLTERIVDVVPEPQPDPDPEPDPDPNPGDPDD